MKEAHMPNAVSFASGEAPADTVSLLPTLPNILFPDFGNAQAVIAPNANTNPNTNADDTPSTEPFTIDTPSKAAWAIACVLEAEERIAQRKALADEYKARLDAWLASANNQDFNSISYLSFLLEPYVSDEVSKLHKSKTLSLPTGTASLRKLPDRLEITDNDTAIAYCEAEHPEAVIIKKELNKSILKDLILKQAEPIPGVEAELGGDKLYIKPLKIEVLPSVAQLK
jgi:phage host-nuclease inhibitor protein Gam